MPKQTAELFRESAPQRVVHLAAQPGVRRSLTHPSACINANVAGFLNILEGCRATGVEHLTYASSSSVYGANGKLPFSEADPVSRPVSLYGAAKRANELMAHSYSHLFALPVTGLRYFTVYGPWGRPDMSPMLFAKKIYAGKPLQVFNNGRHRRDFTYIDDAAEATVKVVDNPPSGLTNWDAGKSIQPAVRRPARSTMSATRTPSISWTTSRAWKPPSARKPLFNSLKNSPGMLSIPCPIPLG